MEPFYGQRAVPKAQDSLCLEHHVGIHLVESRWPLSTEAMGVQLSSPLPGSLGLKGTAVV